MEEKSLLNQGDIAKLLGFSERTVQRYTKEGRIPPPITSRGRSKQWSRDLVLEWLRTGQIRTTGDNCGQSSN